MITHHCIPERVRLDNGTEFIDKELHKRLSGIGVKTAYTTPGSPWENGFCERFNGTLEITSWMEKSFITYMKPS